MMIRTSQNTYYEPNVGKYQIISDLLANIAPYVIQKANDYIALARSDVKIEIHPNKTGYADLPFSGTLNQIVASHASAQSRSIINKITKFDSNYAIGSALSVRVEL